MKKSSLLYCPCKRKEKSVASLLCPRKRKKQKLSQRKKKEKKKLGQRKNRNSVKGKKKPGTANTHTEEKKPMPTVGVCERVGVFKRKL